MTKLKDIIDAKIKTTATPKKQTIFLVSGGQFDFDERAFTTMKKAMDYIKREHASSEVLDAYRDELICCLDKDLAGIPICMIDHSNEDMSSPGKQLHLSDHHKRGRLEANIEYYVNMTDEQKIIDFIFNNRYLSLSEIEVE